MLKKRLAELGLMLVASSFLVLSQPRKVEPLPATLPRVYALFDPNHPGRGGTDYPGDAIEDIPKSYAMILLAETERSKRRIALSLPNLAPVAGGWLLDNARLNENGVIGWGLPVAWDAYGDGSTNPANTIYSISTAIVVDALLTWSETANAPKSRIQKTVEAALIAFIDEAVSTPAGLLPYSLEPADRPYDTYNSAAYLAGQMQRYSTLTQDAALAEKLRRAADRTVKVLIEQHQETSTKRWYWYYSKQEKNANDLPHAGYIVDGLRTYIRYGGALSQRIDLEAANLHLLDFIHGGKLTGWPSFREIDLPPRLYDIGMAMHLSCGYPALSELATALATQVTRHAADRGFSKYPTDLKDVPVSRVNEYEAYLWRGLVACSKNPAH